MAPTMRQLNSPVMYCVNCQDTLSTQCLMIDTHRKHRWVTLKDAEAEQLENIKGRFEKLVSKARNGDIELQGSAAKQKLEDVYKKARESILGHYEKLWEMLENNQKHARFLVEAERETQLLNLNQLEEDAENYLSKTDEMMKNIQALKKQKKTRNTIDQLAKLKALEINMETTEVLFSSMKEKLFDDARLRALESSVKNIVLKSKELLPRPWEFTENITFNKNRTAEELEVSEDASQILLRCFSAQQLKKYKSPWFSAVADQSFSTGQHYWEVEVKGSQSWAVGVVEQSWKEKGVKQLNHCLGTDRVSWALQSHEGELTALHKDESSQVKDCSVHRLGVYIDLSKGKGQMKIYNVSTGLMLHSFSAPFKKPVCPAFSLRATTSSTAQLKLCRITQDNQQYPQQEAQMSVCSRTGGGSHSGAYAESGEPSEQSR
uniref:Tripartite motif-containing protein 60-like n=1 Tax=Astyanax mexicanus TaxID=7994 RepID=A0A3B1ICF0_ASTMX